MDVENDPPEDKPALRSASVRDMTENHEEDGEPLEDRYIAASCPPLLLELRQRHGLSRMPRKRADRQSQKTNLGGHAKHDTKMTALATSRGTTVSGSILSFETSFGDIQSGGLVVREARGREALSTLYEYELTLEVRTDGGLPMEFIDGLLIYPCMLLMTETYSIEVHGVLRELELLRANEANPVLYRVILVPRLWNTTRSLRTMVYQDMTVQDVVTKVLSFSGLEAEWRLNGSYPASEYTVQYEETDFTFVSRLLEHWGLYYYFVQIPDGEVLVIADNNAQFPTLEGYEELAFNPRHGRSGVQGTVQELRSRHRPCPGKLVVREYNWRTPSTPLGEETDVDTRSGFGLQWRYGEHFKDGGQGQQLATIRAEQMLIERELYEGTVSVPGLAPGHKFDLIDCPIPDLNFTYLVTSVEPNLTITGDAADEAYQYRFTAVPLDRDEPKPVAYRSQRTTPKPQIVGFMHGIVDGEAPGTAAPIDIEGRYKVVLPMDMAAEPGGKASRWIRMAQASAGANYGVHLPLHVGTEVAIIHLDGDPDRPVIVGSVPNAETISPVIQDNATQSRIKTRSGIYIEMDDDVV